MNLRPATPEDLPQILMLEEHGFETKQRWSEHSWAAELAADNRTVLLAGSPAAGVIAVQQIGGVAELNRVVVDPAYRRRGVGAALVAAGIAIAVAAEAEEMLLEVRHDNTAALALYAGHGFTEIARRADYYGTGVDAVILRVDLEGENDDE